MTVHSTSFRAEQPVPAADAIEALAPSSGADAAIAVPPAATKKFNFRKLLLTGAAIVVLAGASWYGWDYWTVGQYLVSTDDAYVKADKHHHRAEGPGLSAGGAGQGQ
jgi:membrane fusion protein (multidrug efflux system)